MCEITHVDSSCQIDLPFKFGILHSKSLASRTQLKQPNKTICEIIVLFMFARGGEWMHRREDGEPYPLTMHRREGEPYPCTTASVFTIN